MTWSLRRVGSPFMAGTSQAPQRRARRNSIGGEMLPAASSGSVFAVTQESKTLKRRLAHDGRLRWSRGAGPRRGSRRRRIFLTSSGWASGCRSGNEAMSISPGFRDIDGDSDAVVLQRRHGLSTIIHHRDEAISFVVTAAPDSAGKRDHSEPWST